MTLQGSGIGIALWIAAAIFSIAPATCDGGEHAPRVLPENAVQPPGASFEGYPVIGTRQKVWIGENILGESARELAIRPIRGLGMMTIRPLERLTVRAKEITPIAKIGHMSPICDPLANPNRGGDFGGDAVPARLTLLTDSEPAIQALLRLIAGAQYRIDLMMYGWDDDFTGRQVAEALAAKARSGVLVRVVTDHAAYLIHNKKVVDGSPTFLDLLKSTPNVAVLLGPDPFIRLDHRKLAVIDDQTAWSGGMILTDTARVRWHNFAYIAQGPIVAEFAAVFDERFRHAGGVSVPTCAGASEYASSVVPNASVRLVRTDVCKRSLKNSVYHAIDNAQKRIYIENPYFTDEQLIAKLVAASRRGVEVNAILTIRGNVHRVNQDVTLTANKLYRGGARVYLYPAMTHVKAMSVDGVWAYMGTGNFDELSLRNNREVGLSVVSEPVVEALDRYLFEADIAASQEIHALLPKPSNWISLELFELWY
jgi:phosphatidylserine/phosphatidylglycerophosphate/cardiolipin synthase-like enzyme